MQNGYALCTRAGLDSIAKHLRSLPAKQIDFLRSKLCIGIHRDVEVTDTSKDRRPLVSQAFCSAVGSYLALVEAAARDGVLVAITAIGPWQMHIICLQRLVGKASGHAAHGKRLRDSVADELVL